METALVEVAFISKSSESGALSVLDCIAACVLWVTLFSKHFPWLQRHHRLRGSFLHHHIYGLHIFGLLSPLPLFSTHSLWATSLIPVDSLTGYVALIPTFSLCLHYQCVLPAASVEPGMACIQSLLSEWRDQWADVLIALNPPPKTFKNHC